MYNSHRLFYCCLLFCAALTFFSFQLPGNGHAKKKWVVVIDAGHGGKDPGCHGKYYKEKNVALAVALKLGHYLEENDKNVKVIYTRTTDVFIPLNERAEIANRNHADFFICIHCNASPNHDANGSATYVMGLNKSVGNLEVAKRENSSVLFEKDYKQTYDGFDPNSDEAAVLFAMYQNIYLTQSLDLSTKIQDEYSKVVNTQDNGVKQAGFLVLWKTAMPSLLTEIGFLTNPAQEKVLGSAKGQNEIAKSIFLAFEQYKSEKDGTRYTPTAYNYSPLDVKLPGSSKEQEAAGDSVETTDATPADDSNTASKVVVKPEKHAEKVAKKNDAKQNDKPVQDSTSTKVTNMQNAVKALHAESDTAATFTETPGNSPAADSSKIIYKVQFASSARPLQMQDGKLKSLPDVEMYMDNTTYKYTVGHYYNLKEAVDLQAKMRGLGYKDAFVVTFKGNKRVTLTKLSAK